MKIFILLIKILTCLMILGWPLLLMTSAMMFATEQASNNTQVLFTLFLVLLYPIYIFAIYWAFGLDLFGVPPKALFFSSFIIILLATQGFGYNTLVYNLVRGLNNSGYTLTDKSVYYNGKLLEYIDRATFVSVSGDFDKSIYQSQNIYTKDKNSVYYEGIKIDMADPKTFIIIDDDYKWWCKDNKNVFFKKKLLPNAIASDVKIQDHSFLISNSHVYYMGTLLSGIDFDSFKIFHNDFSKDKNNIYSKDKIILKEAEISSFSFYPKGHNLFGYARDNKSFYDVYLERKIPFIDLGSIEKLERGYFKDKSAIYYRNHKDFVIIKSAIHAQFIVTGWDNKTKTDANDGTNYYINGESIK